MTTQNDEKHELWNEVRKLLHEKNFTLGIKDTYILNTKYSSYPRAVLQKASRKRMFKRAYYPKYCLSVLKRLNKQEGPKRRLILSLHELFGEIDYVAMDIPHRDLIVYAYPNHDYYSDEEWLNYCKSRYPNKFHDELSQKEKTQFIKSRITSPSIKFNLKSFE